MIAYVEVTDSVKVSELGNQGKLLYVWDKVLGDPSVDGWVILRWIFR